MEQFRYFSLTSNRLWNIFIHFLQCVFLCATKCVKCSSKFWRPNVSKPFSIIPYLFLLYNIICIFYVLVNTSIKYDWGYVIFFKPERAALNSHCLIFFTPHVNLWKSGQNLCLSSLLCLIRYSPNLYPVLLPIDSNHTASVVIRYLSAYCVSGFLCHGWSYNDERRRSFISVCVWDHEVTKVSGNVYGAEIFRASNKF